MAQDLDPDRTFTYRELLRASPLPRRLTRRFRFVFDGDNEQRSVRERVTLGETPHIFRAGKKSLHAQVTPPRCFAMHKPTGILTSRSDGPTATSIFDLLPPIAQTCEPIGRLDADTTGLLLFTEDGQLLHRLTHPRWEVPRSYVARLESKPDTDLLSQLRKGELTLRDGHSPNPVEIVPYSDDELTFRVVLTEGKYHEVRRMFAATGARVSELERISYGGVRLSDERWPTLAQSGSCVELPRETVDRLYEMVRLPTPKAALEVTVVEPDE